MKKARLWKQLPEWAWRMRLVRRDDLDRPPARRDENGNYAVEDVDENEVEQEVGVDEANLITSRSANLGRFSTSKHFPVIDLDYRAALIPSTTEGHHHLYLDKEVEWAKYERLLRVLADCGLIEQGYADASIARGYTAVRPPWVRKVRHDYSEPIGPHFQRPVEDGWAYEANHGEYAPYLRNPRVQPIPVDVTQFATSVNMGPNYMSGDIDALSRESRLLYEERVAANRVRQDTSVCNCYGCRESLRLISGAVRSPEPWQITRDDF